MSKKSIFDLDEKVVGLLCYALSFVSGIIIYVMERENKFVRFHALQSTVWFLLLAVVSVILTNLRWLPLIGGLMGFVAGLVGILCFVSWIYLMYMAYKGAEYKIPVLGEAVWNQVNK